MALLSGVYNMPIEVGKVVLSYVGTGMPINSLLPLNGTADVVTKGNEVWLKTGSAGHLSATYPDAYLSASGEVSLVLDDSWLTTGQAIPESLHMQNGKVFTSGFNTGEVGMKEWELDGTATGRTLVTGFTVVGACDNTHGGFWLNERPISTLREYNATTLVATGRVIDFSAKSTNVQSMSVLDGVLYLLDAPAGTFYRYNETTLDFIDSVTRSGAGGSTQTLSGLTRAGGRWYVIEFQTGIIYRYNNDLVYDDYKIDITGVAPGSNWTGLMYNNNKMYCLNYLNQTVSVLPTIGTTVGITTLKKDTDTGLTIYMRGK